MKLFEISTEHVGVFKQLFEVLKEILQETNIDINYTKKPDVVEEDPTEDEAKTKKTKKPQEKKKVVNNDDGMRILGVDPSKVVLIDLKLNAENFTKFSSSKEKITIGLNLGYLHKLIKSHDKDDILSMYQDHDDPNNINIKFDNTNKKKSKITKLKLLDLNKEVITMQEIKWEAIILMKSNEFHKLCREMSLLSDFMEIKCLPDKVIFSCIGEYADTTVTYKVKTDKDDTCEEDISIVHIANDEKRKGEKVSQIIQGIFELKNLVLFGKCGSLSEEVEIFMRNNGALIIRYTVGTLGRLFLCISPVTVEVNKDQLEDKNDEEYCSE